MDVSELSSTVSAAGVLISRPDGRTLMVRSCGLQADEIAEVFWLAEEDAVARHVESGRARVHAAFEARRSGSTAYVDGERVLT